MTDAPAPGAADAACAAPPQSKSALQSLTIQAAVAAGVPACVLLANDAGRIVHGPALDAGELGLAAAALFTLISSATAIWGRCKAQLPIAGIWPRRAPR